MALPPDDINPGLAAVLSLVLPGLGQIYNGRFFWAVVWLVITPGFWIGSGGLLGWVCHLASAWFAYRDAVQLQRERSAPMVEGDL